MRKRICPGNEFLETFGTSGIAERYNNHNFIHKCLWIRKKVRIFATENDKD